MKEFADCPFCGRHLKDKYSGLNDRLETTSRTFSVSECTGCRAGVLNPAPTGDLSSLYPTNYLSSEDSRSLVRKRFDLEKWYRYNQYKYDFSLLRRATGLRIGDATSYLDLGCGSGERVTFAAEDGCRRAVGVDKFDFAKSKAKDGAELINAEILDYKPEERFQVASLFHVLEHLDKPAEALEHIRDEILAPAGDLIIQVPNYGSLESRLCRGRWFGLDVPRHFWDFNAQALERLLERSGYRVNATYQLNAPLHPVTIVPSLFSGLDIQRIWVDRRHGEPYKKAMIALWAGLTVATIPLALLQNLLNRSSMLTVVAARR